MAKDRSGSGLTVRTHSDLRPESGEEPTKRGGTSACRPQDTAPQGALGWDVLALTRLGRLTTRA